MNHALLRKRVVRIVTSPAEVLYAITRHWVLLVVCIAAGTLIMWKKEVGGIRIYEGHAQLLVNPIDTLVVSQGANRSQGRSGDEIQRFLVSQTNILLSDSVLQKLIDKIGPGTQNTIEVQADYLQQAAKWVPGLFFEDDRASRL